VVLDDDRIFTREQRGEMGALAVDILLDASTSQLHRQESIAAQGYIIAESLTRCRIPVRVYSFCSMNGFTIIPLFRDYAETDKNANIFRYFTAGCNRDGLAVRTAARMLRNVSAENKILVILSDCKPNDVMKVRTAGAVYREYTESEGVEDTAAEVHSARISGIHVACVFTGTDDDLPAAKRIYGRHMTRIHSLDHFSDAVSALLRSQIDEV
jgi:nitric oxide reductase activation protein